MGSLSEIVKNNKYARYARNTLVAALLVYELNVVTHFAIGGQYLLRESEMLNRITAQVSSQQPKHGFSHEQRVSMLLKEWKEENYVGEMNYHFHKAFNPFYKGEK